MSAPNAVFFRAYDVDDPSANAPPIDDETKAADNYETLVQLPSTASSSDPNGFAETVLTLSMRPGDNYRVVAATALSQFDNIGVPQNDGASASVTNLLGFPVPANRITPLLTVWRRLHVEVDSMMSAPFGSNSRSGKIIAILGSPTTLATQVVANIFVGDESGWLDNGIPLSNGRFENGRLLIAGVTLDVPTHDILGNGNNFFRTKLGRSFDIPFVLSKGQVVIVGKIWKLENTFPNPVLSISEPLIPNAFSGGTIRAGKQTFGVLANTATTVTVADDEVEIPFTAFDDDDNNVLPHFPDCSDLARAFAPAYVQPFFGLPNPTPLVPFIENLSTDPDSMRNAFRFDNKGTEADPNFWTVYVLGAFQPRRQVDFDPDAELGWDGIVDNDVNGQGAAIFMEVRREFPILSFDSERYTVSHEIGHLFQGAHTNGGLMSQSGVRTNIDFTQVTVQRIRTIPNP